MQLRDGPNPLFSGSPILYWEVVLTFGYRLFFPSLTMTFLRHDNLEKAA